MKAFTAYQPYAYAIVAVYGEGPDAEKIKQGQESVKALREEDQARRFNMLT